MLCYAMLCYAMLCYAMLCYAMLCYAMLCYAMLCCAVLCYAMLCYAMLCYAMLCYAMLCYAMPYISELHPKTGKERPHKNFLFSILVHVLLAWENSRSARSPLEPFSSVFAKYSVQTALYAKKILSIDSLRNSYNNAVDAQLRFQRKKRNPGSDFVVAKSPGAINRTEKPANFFFGPRKWRLKCNV